MTKREETLSMLRAGRLNDMMIEIEVEDNAAFGIEIAGLGSDINLGDMFAVSCPRRPKRRRVTVPRARRYSRRRTDSSSTWTR
jgi:ATP-dependent protease HslVU (ClpYQ) ATPase subunit